MEEMVGELTTTYAATETIINYVMEQTLSILTSLQCDLSFHQKKKMRELSTSYGRAKRCRQITNKYRHCVSLPIRNDRLLERRVQVHFYDLETMLLLWLKSKDNADRVQEFYEKPMNPGEYNSIKNSEIYQKISISSDELVILLGLYCDEVLPLQALYAKNYNYKLYNFYITIILEGPTQRKLEQVFPLCLIYTKDVGELGLKTITEEIADRVRAVVSNGITYNGHHYQVRLVYVIGDNLSQNQLSGITRSWTSGKSCRFCHFRMADLETPNSVNDLAPAAPRTSEEYVDVIVAEQNDHILPHGFTHVPALHRIPHFPMNTTTFVLDLHHDFFLGCAVTWMTMIINRIVFGLRWISASSLRSLWKAFKFRGHDAKNRPYFKFDMSKQTVRICNKVAHVRTLILLFSTVLYPVIENTEDPVWVFYLKVLYLTRLLLTVNHTPDTLHIMEQMIVSTLASRMDLSRTADGAYDPKIKYKEHNILHYPRSIRLAGPLSLQSSSLCEQFHQTVKRAFGTSRCTKNVLKTILRRMDGKLHARSQASIESPRISPLPDLNDLDGDALAFYQHAPANHCLKRVIIHGVEIAINKIILLPSVIGQPDGRFYRVLAICKEARNFVLLMRPIHIIPIPQLGLFRIEETTLSPQIQRLDESLGTIEEYRVTKSFETFEVISLRHLNCNR